MIKHILVPTDGSEQAFVGVRYAVALARQYKATLHGLYVLDTKLLEGPILRDISASLGTAPYVNYQGSISLILEERGKAALSAFEDECKSARVAYETCLTKGIIWNCIVEKSELADLVVMGRGGEHSEWLEGLVGSTTEAVARRTETPVLVTGTEMVEYKLFLVAYDGSRHAKEALQTAADIGVSWNTPFHVLVIDDKKSDNLIEEASSYLEAYDVKVEYISRSGDPDETIINYASECNADLLVMGAYGHTKVRELILGSTTAYALNHSPCPLLLVS